MSEGSITVLRPILALPKHLQAERMAIAPGDKHTIDRNSVIIVEKELTNTVKLGQMGATGDVITAPPAQDAPTVTYASRPEASDVVMARPDIQVSEHGIGAPPMSRSVTEINANQPIAGALQVKSQPDVPKPVIAAKPVTVIQQPPPTPVAKPKMRVKLSNKGMGRVTISVQSVAVGENCIILAYPKDAENIVEPPLCNEDNPIQVDFADKRYMCAYAGHTAELEGLYLVVLIRIDEDDGK